MKNRRVTWLLLTAKRLFCRPSFIALLLLIPVLSGLFAMASREESGIETVVLVAEGGEGELSREIVKSLLEDDSIIRFVEAKDAIEAIEAVEYGRADAAWVFPAGLDGTIKEYAADISRGATVATVYQTGENPLQIIVREKLNGAVFPYLAKELYRNFRPSVSSAGLYPDEDEFMKYYEESAFKESIVNRVYSSYVPAKDDGYLTSPVRGLAALAAMLAALGTTLYSMKDERGGFSSRLPLGERFSYLFLSNTVASVAAAASYSVAVAIGGISGGLAEELSSAAALCMTCAAFSTALGRIFSTPFSLGAAIPPVMIASAVVCPIFVGLKIPARPDLLIPATYAIRASSSPVWLLYAVAYSAVCFAVAAAADLLRRRRAS